MSFQGNTPSAIIYSNEITTVTLKRHRHTGIFDIFHDIGAGSVVGFQITPEQALSDGHFVGGKSGQSLV